jgi:RND family efflux transporter MFP subunit
MRFTLVPLSVLVALWSGCGGSEPQPKTASSQPAVRVRAAAVNVEQWPDVYEATGTVRARTTAVVSSKLMAYVQTVAVQVGDQVQQGQLLITLDSQDLDTKVRGAEAAEAEVVSAIPEADNGVLYAKANLDFAQTTFGRMQELASKKSISSQEFDESSARLKSAQAAYEMARSKRAQLDSKRAQVEQEIRGANIMRDYARISAPFSGVVTAKSVDPGSLAAPGAPLLTLEREGNFRLEASVDESRLPLVKTGQTVEVALESSDRRFPARVSEIVPAVDPASRAYTVKIDLPSLPNVRSGMFGRAFFHAGTRNVLTIPPQALMEHGQLQSVFVVDGEFVHSRLVTTGERRPASVEVLSGLSAGEKVVSPAPPGLTDGARVEVGQ